MPLLQRLATLLALALFSLSALAGDAAARRIAITVDDLPWARLDETVPPDLDDQHRRLVAALRGAQAPIVGFVNENKLETGGEVQPARVRMLRDWLDAGFELGNHTHGHVDLHAVGLPAYQDSILRGERVLRPLLAESGAVPRWFRHPYLRAGQSAETKAALAGFLAEHGYRIAPVTVDNADWAWARAWRAALDAGDDEALARLRSGYVPYMLSKVAYYEQQSLALVGEEIPQVLLLHANEINAELFPALVEGIRARGYRFVTLDEAIAHPAYAREDGYTGRWGPSWIHRWAIAERKPREFFGDEPATPRWVLDLAGVESE